MTRLYTHLRLAALLGLLLGALVPPAAPLGASSLGRSPTPLPEAAARQAGEGWRPSGPGGELPAVRALALDGPALAQGTTLAIATDNGVYRSRDGGASWSDWSGGLPGREASDIVFSAGSFYLAVAGLVFRRGPADGAWSAFAEGLPRDAGAISCLDANAAGLLLAADCRSSGAQAARAVFLRGPADSAWADIGAGLAPTRQIVGLAAGAGRVSIAVRENLVYSRLVSGGAWESIGQGLPLGANDIADLKGGPGDSLYVGLRQLPVSSPFLGGVWRYQPGAGWSPINGSGIGSSIEGSDVLVLAVAPDETVIAAGAGGRLFSGQPHGGTYVWRSAATIGRLPLSLALSPSATATPPDSVLFAGMGAGLLRSLNLGRSLGDANSGLGRALNLRYLKSAPDGTLFAASATRAYRSANGDDWTIMRELEGAEITALAPSAAYGLDQSLFLAALASGAPALQRSLDRGATWNARPISETFAAIESSPQIAADGTLYAASSGLVDTARGGVLLSSDRGLSWDYRNGGLIGRQLATILALPAGAFAPLLAATDDGVYALDPTRSGWAKLGGGEAITNTRLLAASPELARDGALFALGDGGLYAFAGAAQGWRRLEARGLPLADLRALAVSPRYAEDRTLLAAGRSGVWLSSDGGASWAPLNGGLPTLDLRALAFSPGFSADRTILAATDAGLFSYTLPPPAPPWLVLLYLAGDDTEPGDPDGPLVSLSEPLRLLVERLDAMPYNPAMRLVVLFDGNGQGDSRLYVRERDGLVPVSPAPLWFPGDSELDTGSVSILRSFIRWGRQSFPGTRHTFLSLVNHGGGWAPDLGDAPQPRARRAQDGGWRGMSLDERSGSELSTRDTAAALAGLGRFDVLFFDACLMGMVESAYEVQPHADFFLSGQNLLWSALPYEQYLAPDVLTASTTPRELAEIVVDRYNRPAPGESEPVEPFVISAVELARLPELRQRVEALASGLMAALPPTLTPEDPARLAISRAYSESQKFDYDVSLSLDPTDGYVDIIDFARALQRPANAISADVSRAAAELARATQQAVVATRAVSGTVQGSRAPWSFAGANGLSIYLPLGEQDLRPTGPLSDTLGARALERQLYYYTNCDYSGCGQLAFTRDAPSWPILLDRLEETVPPRDLRERPLGAPYPLGEPYRRVYLPLIR